MIAGDDARSIAESAGIDVARLMTLLLPAAALFARPPISNFRVGCVSRGATTGSLYYGANMEFSGESLSATVHAEQSSVTNAWDAGEAGIDLIAVTAPPCGYCRQFLNELVTADTLIVAMPSQTSPLPSLLPGAFGPRDLEIEGGLMQKDDHELELDSADAIADEALRAARLSYAPYSHSYAGVALRFADGCIVAGSYAENAAFNPSMAPLQVALSRANLRGCRVGDLRDAVLVATDTMHDNATRTLLATVSSVPLRIFRGRNGASSNPG